MTLEKCKKCGARVIKKGILDSGNTKFQLWRCTDCGSENAEVLQEKEDKEDFLPDL